MPGRGCRYVYWDTLLKLLIQKRFYLCCLKGLSVFRTVYICGLNDGSFKVPSELEKCLWKHEDKHTKEPRLRILLPVNKVHCQQEMRKRGSVSWPYWWWKPYIVVSKKLVAAFRKKDGQLLCYLEVFEVAIFCITPGKFDMGYFPFCIKQTIFKKITEQFLINFFLLQQTW